MNYPRTIVGLFHDSSAAQLAIEHLLGAGFAPHDIKMATQASLLGHPETEPAHLDTSHESLREGLVRFFKEVFTSHDGEAGPYVDAAHPHSAIVTVRVANESMGTKARTMLDTYGSIGVFKDSDDFRASVTKGTYDLGGDPARLPGEPNGVEA